MIIAFFSNFLYPVSTYIFSESVCSFGTGGMWPVLLGSVVDYVLTFSLDFCRPLNLGTDLVVRNPPHPCSLLIQPNEVLPFTTKIFITTIVFFVLSFFVFHFHRALFSWACGSFFELSFCTFTCLSNNSLISSWTSAKFVSALLSYMLHLSYYFQSEVNT